MSRWQTITDLVKDVVQTNKLPPLETESIKIGASDDTEAPSGSLIQQDFTWSQDDDDLVLSDDDVELIRQPKAGPTQFIQGIDAGPISAPEDSYSQIINTPVTTGASSGTGVGHTLALDNRTLLALEGEANGSGGTTNEVVRFPNTDVEVGEENGGDVRIAGELTENSSL